MSSSYWDRKARISRRKFVSTSGVVAAGATTLALVGCGDDDDDDASPSGGTPQGGASPSGGTPQGSASPSAAAPKTGGILRVVGLGEPSTFDLHQNISVTTTGPAAPMFNGLLQMSSHKDGEILPDLANTLPEQPDQQTYVFKISPSIQFHDGSTLTAEDVKANYDWMIKPPAGKSSTRQSILAPVIDRIETPDTTTIKFIMKQPSASFLLNQTVEYMAIGPKKVLDADGELGKNPVGTGPFTRKSYQPGVSVELVKNTSYFRRGFPYLDGIVVHIIADRRTALENFLGGKIHILSPSAEETKEITDRLGSKVTLTDAPSNSRNMMFMLTDKAPFNDPRVREALSILFDRQEHFALVYQGRGNPIGGYMAPAPAGIWSLPESELKAVPGVIKADPAKAKAMLEQAGVINPTWKLVSRSLYQDLAVWTTEQLRRGGIQSTPQLLDTGAAYAAGNDGAFDVLPWTTVPALDDPDAVFGDIGGVAGAVRNWSRTKDPELDRLYIEQARTFDNAERKKLVNEIDRKLVTTIQTLQFGYAGSTYASYNSVKNKSFLMNENYTNRTYEDIWLDE
jgi:peptide/nickel transport system substrate-binding protein